MSTGETDDCNSDKLKVATWAIRKREQRTPLPLTTPARQPESEPEKKVLYYYTEDLLGIWGQWGTFKKGSWKTSNSLRAWRGGRKKRNRSLNEPFV